MLPPSRGAPTFSLPQEVLEAAGTMGFTIIATTRKEDAVPPGGQWRSFPVLPMDEEDALLVLKAYSGALLPVPRESALRVSL